MSVLECYNTMRISHLFLTAIKQSRETVRLSHPRVEAEIKSEAKIRAASTDPLSLLSITVQL
jgi:hypothetical protein